MMLQSQSCSADMRNQLGPESYPENLRDQRSLAETNQMCGFLWISVDF